VTKIIKIELGFTKLFQKNTLQYAASAIICSAQLQGSIALWPVRLKHCLRGYM